MSGLLVECEVLRGEIERGEVLLVDARRPLDYAKGHIPSAVSFSSYDIFATDTRPEGLKAFARDMATRYLAIGISGSRPIVVYEEDTGMRAAREAWMLQYVGHPHVRMLHGGLAAWRAKGWKLSLEAAEDWTVAFRVKERPELVIGVEEIAARLGSPDLTLLDVRDAEEHAGRDRTACCARRGRIPGSVRIEWTEFLDGIHFRSPQAIRDLLQARGIDTGSEIVPYCHRGARSANAYFALRLAGLTRVRNYIGSWHEWSARADLPLEQG
jgi:thiosulfate/3-mercaptopyruvate sulfurtransferase